MLPQVSADWLEQPGENGNFDHRGFLIPENF
jgi:hypothetical protein